MEIFIEPNTPRQRLVIVGGQPLAQALAALGRAMGYRVVGVGDEALEGADEMIGESAAIAELVHPLTAVVVATHGDHDEVALEHALESGAPYVGLVASRKRAESIRSYLGVRGIGEDRLASLHAPAGLDIRARRPEEIALAILAEIVQLRRSTDTFDWAPGGAGGPAATREREETAVDPVCGMTVTVADGGHAHLHQGTRYHFCCASCLTRFAAEPERYLAADS